jgi:TonB-dependent receptor
VSEEENLVLSSARSYGAKETSFSTYAQVDSRTKLFNVPIVLNFGLRAINTKNESRGFSGVDQRDPIAGGSTTVDGALYHEVEHSRWDVLPSLNANFKIKKNFNYRVSIARGASRPRYRDMVPSNDIEYLDPASEIFDPASPEYIADLGSSVYRGTITSGNPNLEPYTAWMYDNTFELYSKNGSAFVASVFYKDIKNYIGRQTIVNQAYPGEEELGIALPAGQENLLFDISKPINITDAQLYGLELGFNQQFTCLPGVAQGFGLQANYALVESSFDGAVGDATNGFPGTSKHNFNAVMYYQKYGLSFRFTLAYRGNYLSNLGGIGSTRADEAHYTNGLTVLGTSIRYKIGKIGVSMGVNNLTGQDVRRYIGDDTRNLTSYYARNPIWKFALRYKL